MIPLRPEWIQYYELLIESIGLLAIAFQLLVKSSDRIADIFDYWCGLHGDVLADVYGDAGGAEGKEALFSFTEVRE